MKYALLIAAISITMPATGQDCIIADDYASDYGLWYPGANQTTGMRMAITSDRMQSYSPYGWYNSAPALAAAMSYGWQMDMTANWAMQVDLHIAPPVPAQGDLGMAIMVMLEGNPVSMSMQRAWTFGGGTYHNYINGQSFTYRSTLKWINGSASSDLFSYGLNTDDTWYIWWDSATGIMYGGDTLHYTNTAFATSLNGFSSSSLAWIGFGGIAWGDTPAYSANNTWGDNACVLYGNTVGSEVGACCMGDECVQVPYNGCDGTFLGYGVACEDCICDSAPSCPGDFYEDNVVNSTDLNLLLAVWGTDACDYDIDGTGVIGMVDLLTLLHNWGSCN